MKSTILLLSLPLSALAAVNGRCTGSKATGRWKTDGICIKTSTCKRYKGSTTNGACPYDPDDVKCCLIDECNGQPDRLGWSSWCEWTSDKNSICNTFGSYLNNKCPGGDNYKCCETP
ncbi:hypothetical protein B0T16DRAFT_395807 [Cercophora newfieldiana]|uniref:Uncharacterized protein n=1 Tax=Cercophora newfieldiana TaxID=92897 RepID=A0AA39YLP0_9PEZI|nr:hypothetical protein B0T16DRAFT_395807 [Cercophora newfieldiana]